MLIFARPTFFKSMKRTVLWVHRELVRQIQIHNLTLKPTHVSVPDYSVINELRTPVLLALVLLLPLLLAPPPLPMLELPPHTTPTQLRYHTSHHVPLSF